jgi:hypothetical protein
VAQPGWLGMLQIGIIDIGSTLDLYGPTFNKICRGPVSTLSLHELSST